jgi:hypothetical protein
MKRVQLKVGWQGGGFKFEKTMKSVSGRMQKLVRGSLGASRGRTASINLAVYFFTKN